MDVDVLFGLISEAATTIREIGADYIGKPFSAAMVRDLSDKVERSLDGINSELSDLGIEIYADVVPMVCEYRVKGHLKLRKAGDHGKL